MTIDLASYRQPLTQYIQTYLTQKQGELPDLSWNSQVFASLRETVTAGKLLRGSLCVAGYQLLGHADIKPILPLAAALEFMQTALLIHDDIIDNDAMRRGRPSVMAQYQTLAREKKYQEPELTGKNLAICVGDIAFFLGFSALSELELSPENEHVVLREFAREYSTVGLGEMQDVVLSRIVENVSQADIVEVYRTKTARYTFSLPLLMAARFCLADEKLTQQLVALGEKIGLIFQIKDDELGLFGTEVEIGKPATSDAREGKKTLYYFFTMQQAQGADLQRFQQLYGSPTLEQSQLEVIRSVVQSSGAEAKVAEYIEQLEQETQALIAELPEVWRDFAASFLEYNVLRKK